MSQTRGILMLFKLSQPEKQLSPSDVTDEGMVILVRLEKY